MLEVFGLEARLPVTAPVGPAAESLLGRLLDGARTADELVRSSGLTPGDASAAIVELELASLITFEDGVYRASAGSAR